MGLWSIIFMHDCSAADDYCIISFLIESSHWYMTHGMSRFAVKTVLLVIINTSRILCCEFPVIITLAISFCNESGCTTSNQPLESGPFQVVFFLWKNWINVTILQRSFKNILFFANTVKVRSVLYEISLTQIFIFFYLRAVSRFIIIINNNKGCTSDYSDFKQKITW